MNSDAVHEETQALTLYTIGHSNHAMESFLALLKRHAIQILADVRSSPYSRYTTQFNRPDLEYVVERAGIQYLFLGESLGGRPVGDEFYDEAGYVLYGKVAEAAFFL
nr:DUF488 domain-containing protein [Ktedonobacterales bacterium]